MDNGIHFISGLPRSGSTLLSAILQQNPAIHAGLTSALGALVSGVLRELSQGNEAAVYVDNVQREAVLRGLFDNFYTGIHPRQTVFDTNRAWAGRLDLLATLFPTAKIVCCVRHIPWVFDSIERLLRRNRWELSKIFNFDTGGTVYTRVEALGAAGGLIGFARNALKEAMHGDEAGRLLLLPFDTLTSDPATAIAAVYEFTGMPPYRHDFENVSFDAREFDARLGTPGLHTVSGPVRPIARRTVLPPDIWRSLERETFWHDPAFNPHGVRIVQS